MSPLVISATSSEVMPTSTLATFRDEPDTYCTNLRVPADLTAFFGTSSTPSLVWVMILTWAVEPIAGGAPVH